MDFLHLINVRRAISALQGQNIGVLYKTRDCHQTKGIMLLQHDFRLNINLPSYGYNKKTCNQYRTAWFITARMAAICGTFKLKADSDFSALVFSSTPKNKRVFADRLFLGRKYADYGRF